jgi:hypothetical protein
MKNKMRKTKVIMLILTCISVLSMYSKPRVITVEGNFLHQKHVSYTLYELEDNGAYKELVSSHGRKMYSVKCNTKTTYLIKFVDKTQTIKYLELRIDRAKDIVIDIDFSTNQSIKLLYDKKGLKITDMSNDALALN